MNLQYKQILRNAEGNEISISFHIDYDEGAGPGGHFISACPIDGCKVKISSPITATRLVPEMRKHLIVCHDFSIVQGINAGFGEFVLS